MKPLFLWSTSFDISSVFTLQIWTRKGANANHDTITTRLTHPDALGKDHAGPSSNHSNLVLIRPFAQIAVLWSSQLSVAQFHHAITFQMTWRSFPDQLWVSTFTPAKTSMSNEMIAPVTCMRHLKTQCFNCAKTVRCPEDYRSVPERLSCLDVSDLNRRRRKVPHKVECIDRNISSSCSICTAGKACAIDFTFSKMP